jgi:hypothetical protein
MFLLLFWKDATFEVEVPIEILYAYSSISFAFYKSLEVMLNSTYC